MNKKITCFLFLLLISFCIQSSFAQGFYNTTNWRFSNPKQFGFVVTDIDFFDNNNGIAVGLSSGIAYTKDAGVTWNYGAFTFIGTAGIQIGTQFQDVHFASANVAYAVGTNGCMAKTTDGGASWSLLNNPLFAGAKNVNTVWFLDANKGYIAGQFNTPDSLPKLYSTNNGGATWDSLTAPIGGKTKYGYVANASLAPIITNITAKAKEIFRIKFLNPTTAYISGGSSSGSGNFFPRHPAAATTGTCLPNGGTTTTASNDASLVWKFSNGTLTDYSVSKERLGYNGIYNAAPNCSYRFASNGMHTNNFKAMHIVNDTTLLLVSFNNNFVVRINTGVNDSTLNINVPGVYERGRYTLLNAPNPPTNNNSTLSPPIPANAIFTFSNPLEIVKGANGKLYIPVNAPLLGPVNRMMTSVDTGRTWLEERFLPLGRNYSNFGGQAIDILPNGKFFIAGQGGVISESNDGVTWNSTYKMDAVGSFNKIDWADCNNGIATGSGFITRTNNGGLTWSEIIRTDFNALNIQINSFAYINSNPAKAYFVTSVGNIYKTSDANATAPTLDPVYSNATVQVQDIATIGSDTAWACGQSGFNVLAANRSPKVFRTTNAGVTWTMFSNFNVGTTAQTFRNIEFPSSLVGYVSGSRDTIWKTTNAGTSWSKLPLPFPGVTPAITYNDMHALNNNTVFLVGNGFPRKVIIRTLDGGATWQDITGNALAIFPVGNFNSVLFHDANNGYVGCAGGFLVTNNGGATWRLDFSPSGTNHTSLAFSPKTVPAGTPFANRRLFAVTLFNNHILEYGKLSDLNVSASEAIVASCAIGTQGSVTVNASGGIGAYTYSLDNGPFQTSNVFANVGPGPKTVTIKDAYCGIITKNITVPARPTPAINAGPDQVAVLGDIVYLQGNGISNFSTLTWSPATTITSGINQYLATAKPTATTNYALTVVDANGCAATDQALVTVYPYCIKTMDAFTPNGDGQNDKWLVTTSGNTCINKVSVAVFNRYGTEIYRNDNYNNTWDGTYNGKAIPDGTYYYVNTYKTVSGTTVVLKGDVTILR